MSTGVISLIGEDVLCSCAVSDRQKESRFGVSDAVAKLRRWSARYDAASQGNRDGELAAIGAEMFDWLDSEGGWASAWADGAAERVLEIRVKGGGSEPETALLDAPWELLARAGGPLALDDLQLFIVYRRVGETTTPKTPAYADLQLMFMAASPEGVGNLNYEHEETAILEATRRLPMRATVEESGALEFLKERLAAEGPFEALHLSCHGDIDKAQGPVLLLEDSAGGKALAGPGALKDVLGPEPAPLVFLSACRTAEYGAVQGGTRFPGQRDGGASAGGEPPRGLELATPFARRLAAVLPNVVGWDGSVYDVDATDFAQTFYRELATRSPVPRAAALARRGLLLKKAESPQRGRHWHLARVYLGPGGGGPLCGGKAKRGPKAKDTEELFLDKKNQRVPVASMAEFVGRRRQIQSALRAFRDGRWGVLIHGMGALGKSSLAARVANRTPVLRPVVIFERYDALAMFDAILEALPGETRDVEEGKWRERIKNKPSLLADALEVWLSGPLDEAPVLLVIDDLERILEPPSKSDAAPEAKSDYRATLGAVLEAFERAATASHLLITSRYDFRLPDGRGGDLAEGLVRIPLVPMGESERIKQWRAAARGKDKLDLGEDGAKLLQRALAAAAGNPGLQEILTKPLLSQEYDVAGRALDQIEHYRQTGAPPDEIAALIDAGTAKDSDNALTAFFARLSFETYRAALTADQARQLSAATLFGEEAPIPRSALAAAGQALGVEEAETAIRRLLGLGLFDDWGEIGGVRHAAANPLARPLATALSADDMPRLARAAFPALVTAWRDRAGDFPFDPRGVEAARIALLGDAAPDILETAIYAGAAVLARGQNQSRAAAALIAAALTKLPETHAFGPDFIRLGVECASLLGETGLLEKLLAAPVRPPPSQDPQAQVPYAALDLRRATRLIQTGKIAEAEALSRDARKRFEAARDERLSAIAAGQIADILYACGELDEALRIRREEMLPVYERLGDVRERAMTMSRIADILLARGELDEALRIRREEQLPVFERLGDAYSHAVTMGQIADIFQARDELDEALRIRREEELPVYERLGDARSRAVTMGNVAEILYRRGELAEALRIRREEELPVYERLGDARGSSATLQKIATMLSKSGALEQGRIQEVYDALAQSFAIAERLRAPDGIALVGLQLAQILGLGGLKDDALAVLDKAEAAFRKLGNEEGLIRIQETRQLIKQRGG